jgi:hypothetical protein
MENELRFMIAVFENRINKTEEEYKNKCRDDFNKEKMQKYVNRKLKREKQALLQMNILPSVIAVNQMKRFKY